LADEIVIAKLVGTEFAFSLQKEGGEKGGEERERGATVGNSSSVFQGVCVGGLD
jgi:hypothetical protein